MGHNLPLGGVGPYLDQAIIPDLLTSFTELPKISAHRATAALAVMQLHSSLAAIREDEAQSFALGNAKNDAESLRVQNEELHLRLSHALDKGKQVEVLNKKLEEEAAKRRAAAKEAEAQIVELKTEVAQNASLAEAAGKGLQKLKQGIPALIKSLMVSKAFSGPFNEFLEAREAMSASEMLEAAMPDFPDGKIPESLADYVDPEARKKADAKGEVLQSLHFEAFEAKCNDASSSVDDILGHNFDA